MSGDISDADMGITPEEREVLDTAEITNIRVHIETAMHNLVAKYGGERWNTLTEGEQGTALLAYVTLVEAGQALEAEQPDYDMAWAELQFIEGAKQ